MATNSASRPSNGSSQPHPPIRLAATNSGTRPTVNATNTARDLTAQRQSRYLKKLGAARNIRVVPSSPGGGSGSGGMRRSRSQSFRKALYIAGLNGGDRGRRRR